MDSPPTLNENVLTIDKQRAVDCHGEISHQMHVRTAEAVQSATIKQAPIECNNRGRKQTIFFTPSACCERANGSASLKMSTLLSILWL